MSAVHFTETCATPVTKETKNNEERKRVDAASTLSACATSTTAAQALDEFKALRQHLKQLLTSAHYWTGSSCGGDTLVSSASSVHVQMGAESNQKLQPHGSKQIPQTGSELADTLRQIQITMEDMWYILATCASEVHAALSRPASTHPSTSASCGISPANTPSNIHRSGTEALPAVDTDAIIEVAPGSASFPEQNIPVLPGFLIPGQGEPTTAEPLKEESLQFAQRFVTKHPNRMRWPPAQFCYVVHVEFKRGRVRRFFSRLPMKPGNYALVPGDRGYDCGLVIQCALWNPHQHAYEPDTVQSLDAAIWPPGNHGNIMEVIRLATDDEVQRLFNEHVSMERLALSICRDAVESLHLPMEVLDCEYQYDGTKISFFFDSTETIDFRQLNKELYRIFNARIWMQNTNGAVRNAAPRSTGSSHR